MHRKKPVGKTMDVSEDSRNTRAKTVEAVYGGGDGGKDGQNG